MFVAGEFSMVRSHEAHRGRRVDELLLRPGGGDNDLLLVGDRLLFLLFLRCLLRAGGNGERDAHDHGEQTEEELRLPHRSREAPESGRGLQESHCVPAVRNTQAPRGIMPDLRP